MRLTKASIAPSVLLCSLTSIKRAESKKNTNMVKESKYTTSPHQPLGSKVAAELTTKVMPMPKATGKSMLICLAFKSCQALLKNERLENSMTGKLNSQAAQLSKRLMSVSISPVLVK